MALNYSIGPDGYPIYNPPVTPTAKPRTTLSATGAPTTVANPAILNPAPQAGQGAYGKVPGPIEYPTTPYAEATRIYPGLANLTPAAGEQIRSQIAGEFTPQEENTLWDISNRYGVASGMPGAGLWSNRFMGNVIDARQKRIQQGITNYQQLLNELSKMGVDPALAAEIANRNATFGAAPEPEAAAKALEAAYRNSMASPAAGTGNPLGTNTYGQGWNPPGFSPWPQGPQGGTRTTGGTGFDPFARTNPPPNPNAEAVQSSTMNDLINAWLDQIDPVAAGFGTPVDDRWFDPGYSNEELGVGADWWHDPGYDSYGNQAGALDDTWFDPGYSNAEVGAGNDQWAFPEWDFYE